MALHRIAKIRSHFERHNPMHAWAAYISSLMWQGRRRAARTPTLISLPSVFILLCHRLRPAIFGQSKPYSTIPWENWPDWVAVEQAAYNHFHPYGWWTYMGASPCCSGYLIETVWYPDLVLYWWGEESGGVAQVRLGLGCFAKAFCLDISTTWDSPSLGSSQDCGLRVTQNYPRNICLAKGGQ